MSPNHAEVGKRVSFESPQNKPVAAFADLHSQRHPTLADTMYEVPKMGILKMGTVQRQLNLLTEKVKGALSTITIPEWQEIEITVDSGACDTVVPPSLSPHISLLEGEKYRNGFEYEVANGAGLPNRGKEIRHDD